MIGVEVLCETFGVMKEYVPSKDRQAVADHLFSILTDMDGKQKKISKLFLVVMYILKRLARNTS
jgi:hypothetical protein